ncbi:hypothetical protein H4R34_000843 [Dimargaris verticillata]|uniref:Velvet domain-containing protein n=1 Tax=Dimargaris verticillata TaxID=2761393 RepID=A0A9W8BB24_9FUNG|nr:hypothetical protein H4R34_000843 [Dimargaris verticillata]
MEHQPPPPSGMAGAAPAYSSNAESAATMDTLSAFMHSRPQYSEYKFQLLIVQQPQRARMCGFGDKDRRPCTPPPILKLITYDEHGNEVDPSLLDTSFFVVHADLWSADTTAQQNLVLHPSLTSQAPSPSDHGLEAAATGVDTSAEPTFGAKSSGGSRSRMVEIRNLIGSPATSACKLYDNKHQLGIFFIFQDLSIRTEGTFTLKFSFVDIGTNENQLNVRRDCVRDHVFSQPFSVYSAKKFPGMIESTELSKCFVKQGIKISVRKESSKQRGAD